MITESFIVHVKADDIYKDISEDVKARFGTSSLSQTDNFLKEKIKKLKLGGQIIKEFVGLRGKRYSHLKENNDEDKRSQKHKLKIK